MLAAHPAAGVRRRRRVRSCSKHTLTLQVVICERHVLMELPPSAAGATLLLLPRLNVYAAAATRALSNAAARRRLSHCSLQAACTAAHWRTSTATA